MAKVVFRLEAYCTVGYGDSGDKAYLDVDTFTQVLNAVQVLKDYDRARYIDGEVTKEILEAYNELKEEFESQSGGEINSVGEVAGIECTYSDDKGVTANMRLNDNSGTSGWARVNAKEHESEYKRKLAEVKKLATEIMRV